MTTQNAAGWMVVLAVALGGAARAEEAAAPAPVPPSAGQSWSVVGARTAGQNANVMEIGAGWPGLSFTYYRGLAAMLDVGARGSFVYGLEGIVTVVQPGLKLQALLKVRLVDTGKVALGLVAEPGPLFSFDRWGNTLAGFSIPVGLRLGIAPASALTVGVSLDLPLWVRFGFGGGLYVPILTGLGVEYFVRSDLAIFFRTRMGPTIQPYNTAVFTFDATFGLGWRL